MRAQLIVRNTILALHLEMLPLFSSLNMHKNYSCSSLQYGQAWLQPAHLTTSVTVPPQACTCCCDGSRFDISIQPVVPEP